MKHLDLTLEKLEERIAPWDISLPIDIGGGSASGSCGNTKPSKETHESCGC